MHFGIRKKVNRIFRKFLGGGTIIDERHWAKRYRSDQSGLIREYYAEDRLYLLEKIKSNPFKSVLEVGSKQGRNLRMIAKPFPDVKIAGIDISPEAVKIGNELLQKEGLTNVTLFEAKADQLDFDDKSFDLVFVFAVLVFIGPDKIHKVFSEMIRVATKRVLILEWHNPELSKGKFTGHWIYNYEKLLQPFRNEIKSLEITKIPEDEFVDTNWKKYGYYIDARINKDVGNDKTSPYY